VSATSASGVGVLGQSNGSGFGVDASSASGTALRARAGTANKVALVAQGLLQLQPSPAGGASPVGQVTLPSGTTSVAVTTPAATPQSTILLTPLNNPHAWLWVSGRTAGSFTVRASAAPPNNVAIQYLIIN
jgi:hypothetical protein